MSPVNAMPALLIDDVDHAELGRDLVGVAQHGGAVGDVEAGLVHRRADDAHLLGGLGQTGGVDVADGQLRAAAGEVVGERAADARAGAGDDGDLVLEIGHAEIPSSATAVRPESVELVTVVGGDVERAGEPPEGEREARPQRRVVAVLVEVPAGAAAGLPDRAAPSAAAATCCRPAATSRRTSKVAMPLALHRPQRAGQVVQVRLDHVDHRAVPEAGVRADHEQQVREAGDGRALVGLLPSLVPHLRPATGRRRRRCARRSASR